jgi:hypothetical protein
LLGTDEGDTGGIRVSKVLSFGYVRSLYSDTRNLGEKAARIEQQLDRRRATTGNIYERRGNVYDPAYDSGPGERSKPDGRTDLAVRWGF